jgi:hypothetical protein
MSFDAPVVHFGVGEYEAVDSVAIEWSDGGMTTIDSSLPAGSVYRIERAAAATR